MKVKPSSSGREKLLTTAGALFAADGFDRVSTKELAARAGMSIGAMYHHFPSKLAIYRATLEWAVLRIARPVTLVAEPIQELRALIAWFCSVIAAQAVESQLLCRELLDPKLETRLSDFEPFGSTFQRFQALFKVVAPGDDAEQALASIVSLSFGFARLGGLRSQVPEFTSKMQTPTEISETVIAILFRKWQ